MSRTPYLLPRVRWGLRMGHAEVLDGMTQDGFLCPLCGRMMGETAETLAKEYGITRQSQDAFALLSQRRVAEARRTGLFTDEIVPVSVPGSKGRTTVVEAEPPRPQTTAESLAALPPVFGKDGGVTAGNSSGITDGAAALVLGNREAAEESA